MYAINKVSVLGHIQYKQLQPDNTEPEQRYNDSSFHALCSSEIEDNSPSKNSITVHGRVLRSPVSPFNEHYSALFSGGFLSTNVSSSFALGDTFTVECWVKPREISGKTVLFDIGSSDRAGFLRVSPQCVPYTSINDSKPLLPKNATLPLNTWTHLAVVSDSNGTRLYMNGAKIASSKVRADWPTESKRLYIGADCGGGCTYNGYMSNLRMFRGTALYTAAYTPQDTPPPSRIPLPAEA